MAQVRVVLKSVWDDKAIKQAEKNLLNFGANIDNAFRTVAVGVGIATAAFAKFGSDAIKEASSLEESTNAVNVAFGQAARGVLAIGENAAESLGVSRTEFNQAAVRFSAFAERVVGQGGDVAGFIQTISQRATDFASVFNIDVAEALRVFQSGLSGEAEPLKRFGINLLDSEVKAYALRAGIIAVGDSMTETQKVQARFGLLMEATAKTAGDFANTSDSLANRQRILAAQFSDLQATVGEALLPAVSDLVNVFADRMIPLFEEFGAFLNSPEGKQAVQEFADGIANLFTFIADNLLTIVDFAIKIAAAVTALKVLKTALELATIAQAAFNIAVKANPYIIAASALAALIGGIALYSDLLVKSGIVKEQDLNSSAALEEQIRRLNEAHEDGLIPTEKFEAKLAELETALQNVNSAAAGVDLSKLRGQFGDTRVEAERLVNAQRQLFLAMGGKITAAMSPPKTSSTTRTNTNTAKSAQDKARKEREAADKKAAEEQRKALEKARNLIDDANKQLGELQTELRDNLAKINSEYLAKVAATNKEFANRLNDIVKQSQNRLRDAYRAVVSVSISDLFGEKTTRKVKTEITRLIGGIRQTIVKETEETVGGSVNDLVAGLTKKLSDSKQLLENASSLAAQGFSQTFIEQVVSAGVETGNELAGAILEATPETQEELKNLFSAVEQQANNGMDVLAKSIYDKAGLATQELKDLYTATQQEQVDALLALQEELNKNLTEANNAFQKSVADLREKLKEDLEAIKGDLTSLMGEIDLLMAKLAELAGLEVTGPSINVPPPVIPVVPDPNKTPPVTQITVIAKTDPTKSAAETGKQISKAINRYTLGGGGIASKVGAV
jgi:DNA-directed RNA polymerase subunit F